MNPHEVAFRNTATQQHKLPLNAFTEHAEGQLQIAQKIASLGNKFANAMQEIGQATYSIKESINADKYGYEYEAIPGEGYQEFLKRKESLASSQFFSQQQQFINDQTSALRNSVLNGEIRTSKQFDDTLVGLEKAALENAQKIIENSEPITKERLAKKLESASKAMFAENGIKARQEYFQIAKDIRQKQYITNAQDCALIGDIEGVQAQMTNTIQDGGNIAEISPLFRSLSNLATAKQYEIDVANRTHNSVEFRANLSELRQNKMKRLLKDGFLKEARDADGKRLIEMFDEIDEAEKVKIEKQRATDNVKSKNAIANLSKSAEKCMPLCDFDSFDRAFWDALVDGSNSDDALELKNKTAAAMIVRAYEQLQFFKVFGTNSEIDKSVQKALLENIGAKNENFKTALKTRTNELPLELQKEVNDAITEFNEKIKAGFIQKNAFNNAEFAKIYEGKNILKHGNNKITTTQEARIVWTDTLNKYSNEHLKAVYDNYIKNGGKVELTFSDDFLTNLNYFKNATEGDEHYAELFKQMEQGYNENIFAIEASIEKHKEEIAKMETEVAQSFCAEALKQNEPKNFVKKEFEKETTYSIGETKDTTPEESQAVLISLLNSKIVENGASGETILGAIKMLHDHCTQKDFDAGLAYLAGNKLEGTLPAQESTAMLDEFADKIGYSNYKNFATKLASKPDEEKRIIANYLQMVKTLPADQARKLHAQTMTNLNEIKTKEGKYKYITERNIELNQKIESIGISLLKARQENQRQAKLSKTVVEDNANQLRGEIEDESALEKAKQLEEQEKKKSSQKPNTDWRMVQI